MRKDRSWGDHLTLTAIAHLTLRPITIIIDNEANQELHIDPPEFVSPDAWGPRIYLIHRCEVHYEGTETEVEQNTILAASSVDFSSIPACLLQSRFQHIVE